MAHMTLTSSLGSEEIAIVRQRHRQAVRSSNDEQRRRCGGRRLRRARISAAPKKKERCTMWLLSVVGLVWSVMLSYSRCLNDTCGGTRALSRCLSQTGGTDGASAPRESSPITDKNWRIPTASLIVWLMRRPKTNPPHFRRVTYTHKQTLLEIQN